MAPYFRHRSTHSCRGHPASYGCGNVGRDRVPAEAMQEFFDRFENALQADPEAMLAAWKSEIPLSIILTGLN